MKKQEKNNNMQGKKMYIKLKKLLKENSININRVLEPPDLFHSENLLTILKEWLKISHKGVFSISDYLEKIFEKQNSSIYNSCISFSRKEFIKQHQKNWDKNFKDWTIYDYEFERKLIKDLIKDLVDFFNDESSEELEEQPRMYNETNYLGKRYR